ncbi:MAG: tRNA (N6-threonylcarbamoyladenosine(37)-N6)-methyltransferase TrmO [Planctomycetes bacterium]|nr:tRNA (N6-threonylcarbamoyladenosine(37)-N6)-methyltransferase TrmO [Planctomycetota bacterium]
MNLQPIGFVKSPVIETVDTNWGRVDSEIHVNECYAAGLQGLDQFSHAVIIFYMQKSEFKPDTDLIRHPRNRSDLSKAGIFCQRAKSRPNPIGITAVKIVAVQSSILQVKGLDAIDGTPVLDIKPYVPAFDRIDNATIPVWIEEIMRDYF